MRLKQVESAEHAKQLLKGRITLMSQIYTAGWNEMLKEYQVFNNNIVTYRTKDVDQFVSRILTLADLIDWTYVGYDD